MIESFKLPNINAETVSGSICSFNDEYGGLPLKSCVSQISGYQEGSGTPSPDNVRPLHAFSSGLLSATGKNLIPDKRYQYNANNLFLGVDNSDITHTIYLNSGVYTFSISSELTGIVLNVGNSQTSYNTTSNKYTFTVTTPDYYRFWVYKSGITSADIDSFQLEIGQATNYEAYNGNTYTFTFGQSIYQGSIDWKRGVVVGTHGIVDLGSLTWLYNTQYINPIFMANIPEAKVALNSGFVPNAICSQYQVLAPNQTNVEGVNHVITVDYYYSSYNNIYIIDKDYTDPTAFKTAMNGVMLAYELATPIEIPLGGINLLTQEGQNNIFCDTGNTSLKYIKVN